MNRSDRPLAGQVAIVTGASRGIGRAIAQELARLGAAVAVNYLHLKEYAEQVASLCESFGVRAIPVQADVTKPEDVARLVETACLYLGKPDILVNNAGIASHSLLIDTTEYEWDRVMAANLKAPFLCAKSVLPHMIRKRYGRIINMSSIWGIAGGSGEVAYSAAKGGLISFTKALAKEMGASGITVNAVAPGVVETDMLSMLTQSDRENLSQQTPVGRLGTPQDIASVVSFLALPASGFITGQVISPNGGFLT
ncbi:elongation factor P 5-aminopentanone reductase [Effusibacillus pohliae]|uniref:elongation factor P 5-aminopentanone reductase n=1 Tax=Effusibacillus pohliae TaxID=232270 RepID=UPI0003672A80|nr:3-oxoacyl-ACP reductase FabG [Effusibacillus pohliae]